MPQNTVRILHVQVGRKPVVRAVPNDLASLQKLVGGYLEWVPGAGGIDLWCNEEGLVLNLPHNRTFAMGEASDSVYDVHGDFFFARNDGQGEIESLTAEDVLTAQGWLRREP